MESGILDYYPLHGEPLTLEQTAKRVGISLSTLQKRRSLLGIQPVKAIGRVKYIRGEDIALLQYVEQHPAVAVELFSAPENLKSSRQRILDTLRQEAQKRESQNYTGKDTQHWPVLSSP